MNSCVVVVLCLFGFGFAAELPANFIRCRANDPNLNECLKNAVPDALRKMKDGIPSLKLAPLEPLKLDSVTVSSGGGAIRLSQSYTNINLHGLTTSNLLNYDANLKKHRLQTDSFTPRLEFSGDYVMKGRILLLPISGKGLANITMLGLTVKHDLIGHPVMKDGEKYMHIKTYKVSFIPKKVILYFGNLFNGDKLLGDQMNRFLNENWELVFNELKSSYEESLSSVFKDVTNAIFDKVPMNKIFLPE